MLHLTMAFGTTNDVNLEKFDFDSIATSGNYIDRGAFGEVYGPFEWNSRKCAFKRIWIPTGRAGNEIEKQLEDKKSIWTSVKHKHLIEIHNVILGSKALYIVMEYASGGSLRNVLDKSDGTVHPQIDVSNWATQIASGMLYLHEKNIVHRDLKSNNIMLMEPFESANPDKEITLKIADFDDVKEHSQTTTMSFRGTAAYTAPEVLITERFSKASDVWSYGVVVWEMLTGGLPHEDDADGSIMLKAMTGQLTLTVPESIPKAYRRLLSDCFHNDKDGRPSFENIIDKLIRIAKEGDQFRIEYNSDPVLVSTIVTRASEEQKKPVRGFAIIDKELFVLSGESREVEVYDAAKFSHSRQWDLKELITPWDIASCNRFKCLYISAHKGFDQPSEILRVDPDGILMKKWSVGDTYGWGSCISVTEESNIILTLLNKHELDEYSPDGKLIRVINLSDAGIRCPWHAIKLANGHFVVSHGGDLHTVCGVCEVDGDGKLEKTFDESTTEEVGRPGYLLMDGNGFVMVADRGSGRVLLLDSDLQFKREIFSTENKHGLQGPSRILFDESNGRLFVADNASKDGGMILIFNVE